MSLTFDRQVTYLSYSSLNLLETNPLEFYLQRLGPWNLKPPKMKQTYHMAVGSSFDSHVKAALAAKLGLICPPLDELLKTVEEEAYELVFGTEKKTLPRQYLIDEGARLLKAYRSTGAFEALIQDGLTHVELLPGEQEVPGTKHHLMGREVKGVPLMGRPDAAFTVAEPEQTKRSVPHDWKVTFATSPNPGYVRRFDTNQPMRGYDPAHDRYQEPFEALSVPWATQLTIYHWLLHPYSAESVGFRPAPVSIDQVLIQVGSPRVQVARFRGKVSGQFQATVRQRLLNAWQKLQANTLLDGLSIPTDPSLARLMR